MEVLVIDGQGGGIGKSLVEGISRKCPKVNIIAVGTNSLATSNMLKGSSCAEGATGENAVIFNSGRADIIIGPVGIIMANAMHGEITPKMAEAVSSSRAKIILIPMNRCHATIVGIEDKKLSQYIEEAIQIICDMCD